MNFVKIATLRPTQICVGMREVNIKRNKFLKRGEVDLEELIVPAVRGPGKKLYIIDRHHTCMALLRSGVQEVIVNVVVDLSGLPSKLFWNYMDNKGMVYPIDSRGNRKDFKDLPKKLTGLKDDPYRSLASEVKRSGGFAKDTTPFSEFLWAEYLRVKLPRMNKKNFMRHKRKALNVAKHNAASYLPGWSGKNFNTVEETA